MDDICDSVRTVQQAKRLTTELDEVLMKGGFQVKGMALKPVSGERNCQARETQNEIIARHNIRESTRNCLESC